MAPSLLLLAIVSVPPPVVTTDPSPSRPLIAWMPGTIRCGDTVVTATTLRRPLTELGWSAGPDIIKPVTLRFRIDDTGRPLSIERSGTSPAGDNGDPFSQDIEPSFAASRFAPGAARTGCTIEYRLRRTQMAMTPVEDLVSYTISPVSGPLPKAGWDRIRSEDGTGGDCFDPPRAQPLVSVLPDFARLPATPGVRDWTLVGYDLDRSGRPIRLRTLHGTGNAALDAAGLKAMRGSRFASGPRTGCRYPYWKAASRLVAPAMPDPATLQPAGGTCPANTGWATPPRLTYPEPYRRRSVEGWAIIAYDVAPWGEPGNARVLASEPSADFGQRALRIIGSARKPASAVGGSGCVDAVRFVMGPEAPAADDPASPPLY